MKPRRSTLSVPGHRGKMHPKAAASPADVIMLDLEDSVPLEAKSDARRRVINSLREMDWGERIVACRINGLDTPFGYRDLLEIAEAAGDRLDSVVIPKVDDTADVHFVSRLLDGIELQRGFGRRIDIEVSIESARGLVNVNRIAAASDRIRTLVFGIADYQASIGARLASISGHGEEESRVYPGHRWNFAMGAIVNAAKACGLLAIDAPYGNFKDLPGLQRSAALSCALGFDGKWVIHPEQIDTVNHVFLPSSEEIQRAGKVLAAYREAAAQGVGAVSVEGRMVDNATVRLARQLWEKAKYLKLV